MKIIVGSVFSNDSEKQQQWLDLQLRYLKETTEDFDHVACITGIKRTNYFDKTTVIEAPGKPQRYGSNGAHAIGLNALVSYFKKHRDNYQGFLLIDNDAFPIATGWVDLLATKMRRKQKEIAAPIRYENIETRIHPSILFILPQGLSFMRFDVAEIGQDLLGNSECDSCVPEYEGRRRGQVFPLLRSNKYNIDPLYCGVYYNIFYHHGAGSRTTPNPRGRKFYWSNIGSLKPDRTMDNLFDNPSRFINRLAGWTPNLYPTVEGVI